METQTNSRRDQEKNLSYQDKKRMEAKPISNCRINCRKGEKTRRPGVERNGLFKDARRKKPELRQENVSRAAGKVENSLGERRPDERKKTYRVHKTEDARGSFGESKEIHVDMRCLTKRRQAEYATCMG